MRWDVILRRIVKGNNTYDHMNHGCYVHVGEKVNYYEYNFNAMIVLNKISGCSELLMRKLDCARGRMLRADVIDLVITEEKKY